MELNLFSNPWIFPGYFSPFALSLVVPGAQVCGVSALGLNINSRHLWCPDTRETRQILLSTPGTAPAPALEGGSENIVICRAILLSRVRPCHVDIVVTYIMIYRRPRHTGAPESLSAGNLLSQPSYNWGGMPSRGRVADTGQVKNKFFILIYSHCWHRAACIHPENTGQMSFSHSALFSHYLRSFSLRWRNLNCSII